MKTGITELICTKFVPLYLSELMLYLPLSSSTQTVTVYFTKELFSTCAYLSYQHDKQETMTQLELFQSNLSK